MGVLKQEKFYTAGEIAKMWRVSTAAVLATFRKQRGVFRLGTGNRPHLRIPEHVLRKVMTEHGWEADDKTADE